jgi:hypothetical protein
MMATRVAGAVTGDLLLAGRGLSLLFTLGIGLVIALTVALATPIRAPWLWRLASAAFGGVVPLLTDSVARWASLMRVDMMALFLMYAGLAVYIVLGRRQRWQYAAAALFILALFTKQTMLSAPLACVIFGLVADRRGAIRASALAVLLGLAGVLFLNIVTNGGFLKHVVEYNLNPFSWKSAVRQLYFHIYNWPAPVLIAAAAALGVLDLTAVRRRGWRSYLQSRSSHPYDRTLLVSGLNWLLAGVLTLSIGKAGSSYNFFLGWDIAAGVLSGLFLFRLLATWKRTDRMGRSQALLCALLLTTLLLPSEPLVRGFLSRQPADAPVQGDVQVMQMLRETQGPVFSENLLLLVRASKTCSTGSIFACW